MTSSAPLPSAPGSPAAPLILVTGFGAFEDVGTNPSREVARALEAEPPAGVRVRAAELPVAFDEVGRALARALGELAPERPAAILSLGVQKLSSYRLERRARGRLTGRRADNRGRTAGELARGRAADRTTPCDLARLAEVLREAGAPRVTVSDDAGAYVCERTYYEVLGAGARLGARALFLHVPPSEAMPAREQVPIVRELVRALA